MNKTNLSHIQINIDPKNKPFYKDLLTFLGWSMIMEEAEFMGMGCEIGPSLWFCPPIKKVNNDYDGIGMNHLGIYTKTQKEVDEAVEYLKQHQIQPLFETPRHRPEFCRDAEQTYYQVMFESPDHILFEIVYSGPLAK